MYVYRSAPVSGWIVSVHGITSAPSSACRWSRSEASSWALASSSSVTSSRIPWNVHGLPSDVALEHAAGVEEPDHRLRRSGSSGSGSSTARRSVQLCRRGLGDASRSSGWTISSQTRLLGANARSGSGRARRPAGSCTRRRGGRGVVLRVDELEGVDDDGAALGRASGSGLRPPQPWTRPPSDP